MTSDRLDAAVTLRLALPSDAPELARLAQLDTQPLAGGPYLVAERGGTIDAAISLARGEIVANPFVRTAEICDLLRVHRQQAGREAKRSRAMLRLRPLGLPA